MWSAEADATGCVRAERTSLAEVEAELERWQLASPERDKHVERLQEQLEASWRARTAEQKALRDCRCEAASQTRTATLTLGRCKGLSAPGGTPTQYSDAKCCES